MQIGVLAERADGEKRVALTPDCAKILKGKGFSVLVEMGAGERAGYTDAAYQEAGAEIAPNGAAVIAAAEIVLKVLGPADGSDLGQVLPETPPSPFGYFPLRRGK